MDAPRVPRPDIAVEKKLWIGNNLLYIVLYSRHSTSSQLKKEFEFAEGKKKRKSNTPTTPCFLHLNTNSDDDNLISKKNAKQLGMALFAKRTQI